jgi:hypothetical protein
MLEVSKGKVIKVMIAITLADFSLNGNEFMAAGAGVCVCVCVYRKDWGY